MGAEFVQNGAFIDYTPAADVASGDVIVIGDTVGVAVRPIAADELGSIAISGVFRMPKAAGSDEGLDAGILVYWDDGEDEVTDSASGNTVVGYTVAAAADEDDTVLVKLSRA